jgi:hypothetical protein
MSAGVIYAPTTGARVDVAAVTTRAFTASKDTYVDISPAGSLSYTEVTNGAASPSLTSGYMRLAIVITGASSISTTRTTGFDNIGNKLRPELRRASSDGFQEIGGATLDYVGTTLTVPIPVAKKYLRIRFAIGAESGTITNYIRFNADSGANYNVRISTNTGATTTVAGDPGISVAPSTANYQRFGEFMIYDFAGLQKWVEGMCTGGSTGSAPVNRQTSGNWANTARITSISIVSTTNNFSVGSELIVEGK